MCVWKKNAKRVPIGFVTDARRSIRSRHLHIGSLHLGGSDAAAPISDAEAKAKNQHLRS
jgi:hypothetical protein